MTRRYTTSSDPRVAELLEWLRERRAGEEYAPTNADICERFKLQSASSAAALVARAERSGAIDVERRQRGRIFSFAASNGRPVTIRSLDLVDVPHKCRGVKRT